jgi:hypothetical protein
MTTISTSGPSLGVAAINGKTGTSQRSRPRVHDEGREDDNNADADTETDTPIAPAPGTGRLIDKLV